MELPNDKLDLIVKATRGDLAALEKLLLQNRRRLLAYVQGHLPEQLRSSHEPQDVVQDTFFRAIRGISEFKPSGTEPVFRWMVTIARHVMADQLKYARAAKRKGTRLATGAADDDASIVRLLEELAVYQRTPSKSAASHELMATLDGAIKRLPKDQGQALSLRYLSGMEITEIAIKMDRTAGAISMLCNRALKKLRLELRTFSLYI